MSRNRLYTLVGFIALAGFAWVAANHFGFIGQGFTPCLFRNVTGIPCPSCGTTEAIICAANGEFLNAIVINPLVLFASVMLAIVPMWVLADLLMGRSSFHSFYLRVEKVLKVKIIAFMAIVGILAVWAWVIYRHFQ